IPQISYASTSSELSQKPRFQYFSRVVPPDTYQAEAVVEIIQFLNWTYVAVIKETGSYGERLTDDFKAKLKNKNFDSYFESLRPSTNIRNPFFIEYWEQTFKCKFNDTSSTIFNENFTRICTGYVHYVVDAVFALVIAAQKLINEKCKTDSLCDDFFPINGTQLLSILRNISYKNDLSQRNIRFTDQGDGIGTYDIFQYQVIDDSGKLGYVTIGDFSDNDGTGEHVHIDLQKVKWFDHDDDGVAAIPLSYCSPSCNPGHIRTASDSQQCCWTCAPCKSFEIAINDTECLPCSDKEKPNINSTKCVKVEEEYLSIQNVIAWPAIILSSIGLLMAVYTILIFIRFGRTPIIKASSRELCYLLLTGICFCHLCVWPLVLKPHIITCFLIRISVGLSLTICLAALLTKTNRLARIFNSTASRGLKQPSCLSPRSQIGLCGGIVSFQLIGVILWIVIVPPSVKQKSEEKHNQRRIIRVCQTDNEYIVFSLIYNMVLVICCTLYAIKTRHIPENFNEAKHIGFAMYSVCIIWMAFLLIFFGVRSSENWFRIQLVSLAICLSLSATVILFKTTLETSTATNNMENSILNSKQQTLSENISNDRGKQNSIRHRLPSTDYSEVTMCSKSDSAGFGDEIQMLNGACTDAERRIIPTCYSVFQPSTSVIPGNSAESTELIPKRIENPWKKIGNVRIKCDSAPQEEHIQAEHVTFV
ncbi:unnamed protein product, partial [Didymodactylos carnosus]